MLIQFPVSLSGSKVENPKPYVFRNNLRPQNFTRFDDENQNTIAEIEAISLGRDQNAMAGTKMPRPNK